MKKATFVLMILALVMASQRSFANDNKNVLGTWKVSVADAPYEYVKSSFIVSEDKGVLAAKVVFEDGQELKVSGFEYAKNMVRFEVNIDGNDIKVTGKVENDKMTGKVDAPDGMLDLVAVKKL